jgi:hypothetical protein
MTGSIVLTFIAGFVLGACFAILAVFLIAAAINHFEQKEGY